MNYIIFTDGSSRGNPGPSGWGAIIIRENGDDKYVLEIGGREERSTNNRMELTSIIKALKETEEDSECLVYSDSKYLINGITTWIKNWQKNGWRTKDKKDVLNKDLWQELHELTQKRQVRFKYVGGHSGITGNERCDVIATEFADGNKPELFSGPFSSYLHMNVLKAW